MKQFLTMLAMIFVGIGVFNLPQNETTSFILVIVGGIFLAYRMISGRLKAGSA